MPNFDPAELTISDVVERTGIPASTLRMWEARYGFPDPRRPTGSHRRYSLEDCRALAEVKRARARGLGMRQAVEAGMAATRRAQDSLFNGLRLRHPDLPVLRYPQAFMLALSRAVEVTALEHGDGVLVGAFQRRAAHRVAEPVWQRLATTADAIVLFADFDASCADGTTWRIPIPDDSPLAAEWAVVCDSPRWWACLVGRELHAPGRVQGPRMFEAMWSLEPTVVRDAARIAAALASATAPEFGERVAGRLQHQPTARPSTLREASQFTNRVLEELLGAARNAASVSARR
jgi:DICT domain-containing protein